MLLMLSNLIQTLYNVADMLIVENFVGPAGVSGVNIGGQVTLLITNIVEQYGKLQNQSLQG